jgi:hypothetical protein
MITIPSNQVVNDLVAGMAGLLKQSMLDYDAFIIYIYLINTKHIITFNDTIYKGQEATLPINQYPMII